MLFRATKNSISSLDRANAARAEPDDAYQLHIQMKRARERREALRAAQEQTTRGSSLHESKLIRVLSLGAMGDWREFVLMLQLLALPVDAGAIILVVYALGGAGANEGDSRNADVVAGSSLLVLLVAWLWLGAHCIRALRQADRRSH